MNFIDMLIKFGLTRQEATIYQTLLEHGEVTGYEVAKLTGISRSNTYNALAGLVEKGAAYIIEGSVTKYLPVKVENFSADIIRNLTVLRKNLIECAPDVLVESQGYITIKGEKHIYNRMRNMLEQAKKRIYIIARVDLLLTIKEELTLLCKDGKKVVVITDDSTFLLEGATVYRSSTPIHQFGLIADSVEVLSGETHKGENIACLYSKNRNFVDVYKEMLANKIDLIILQGGNEK